MHKGVCSSGSAGPRGGDIANHQYRPENLHRHFGRRGNPDFEAMLALRSAAVKYSRAAGFTLIELMVTIAIAAILMVVAVPSFVSFQRNSELTGAANSLLASINAARGEGMKRNMTAIIVPKDMALWKSGWIVFVDVDRSETFSAGDILISTHEPLASYFSVVGDGSTAEGGSTVNMRFSGAGYAKKKDESAGNFTFSLSRNDVTGQELLNQTRRIVVVGTGRARVCKPTSASDPSCKPGGNSF